MRKITRHKSVQIILVIVAFLTGYVIGSMLHRLDIAKMPKPIHEAAHKAEEVTGKTMWTCSMHPQIRMPKPGRCPICGMELIPVKEAKPMKKEVVADLILSERARKLAEVMVEPVRRKFVEMRLDLFGKITYDETRLGYITARFPGRLDKLYVDYTGTVVRKGEPMVEIYSPELLTAQQELFHALQAVRDLKRSKVDIINRSAEATVEAAREKLLLWDLTPEQIRELEKKERPDIHVTLYAPMGGVVIKKNALEGMYVKTGTIIYEIADLSYLWVMLDVYESDIKWLHLGQDVSFVVEAFPGEIFHGTITFINPFMDEKTRVIKVRVEVKNIHNKLKPDMFVKATVYAKPKGLGGKPPLVIPASAPLITGKRAVVYVELPEMEGAYVGREVVLGPRLGDYYEVVSGLKEGEKVVVNGNFKIDSAVQILAKPSMMNPKGGMPGGSGSKSK
ncbi:MAG: efflux RND transporter periplasmic adaptor subunit [Nitrospirae bacterium]|nr:MAG: efflux RND transporter periplasmic adaptor subunit [Nitrospirota bacterium]